MFQFLSLLDFLVLNLAGERWKNEIRERGEGQEDVVMKKKKRFCEVYDS